MVCNSEVTRQTPITASNIDDAVSLFHLFLVRCTRYSPFLFSLLFFLFLLLHLALLSSSHYGFSSPTPCAYTLYTVLVLFFFSTFCLLTLSLYNVFCSLALVAPLLTTRSSSVWRISMWRISMWREKLENFVECITRIMDNKKESKKSRLIRFTYAILFERFISVKFNHFNFFQNQRYPFRIRFSNMHIHAIIMGKNHFLYMLWMIFT